ncbi:MAG: prepilin peptidase [Planctomycetota bacterium]
MLQYYFIVISSAVFGSIFGSFSNVMIYRLPREGLSVLKPKYSFCPKCGKTINWYDNIPVFSYLFLLRCKCRNCKAGISPRYAFVEALSAFFFGFCAHKFAVTGNWGEFFVSAAFCQALIVCTFIDIDFRIIPDAIDIPGMIIAPILCFLVPSFVLPDFAELVKKIGISYHTAQPFSVIDRFVAVGASGFGMAAGAGFTYLVGVIGKVVFRKDAMGFGDVKLMGMIGGIIGFKKALVGFFAGCVIGAVIGITLMITAKRRDPQIPFGPFLAIGNVATMFYMPEILNFLLVTYPSWILGR